MKITRNKIFEWVNVTIGVMLASFAFSFFIAPNQLVIGGVSGIGVILGAIFHYDPAFTILIINGLLLVLGLLFLGKEFFAKTVYGSLIFPGFIKVFDIIYNAFELKPIDDNLLVIVFSSVIMGFGLGLAIKNGGTTGGVDIPQNILLKFFHIPFSTSLIFIDGTVILMGFFFMPDADISLILYGALFISLSGIIIDQVVFSGFNKRAVFIISEKNEEIKKHILEDLGRGVTQIRVIGGYTNADKNKLVCVLSTFEFLKLKKIIYTYDKNAFFYAVRASEVSGEGFSYEK